MKIDMRQSLPAAPEKVWNSFFDDELETALAGKGGVTRELISEENGPDGRITRRLRFTSKMTVPGPMKKALGSDHLTYDQISVLDPKTHTVHWHVEPPVMKDKIKAEGTLKLEPTKAGCDRHIQGDVSVKVPLIGKKIEGMVAKSIADSYEGGMELLIDWLNAN